MRRQPRGTRGGGRFAPDTSGKTPPTAAPQVPAPSRPKARKESTPLGPRYDYGMTPEAMYRPLPAGEYLMTPESILAAYRIRQADRKESRLFGVPETDARFWRRKHREAVTSGLAADLAEHGTSEAIWVNETGLRVLPADGDARPEIVEGHHRLAVLMRTAPDTPVRVRVENEPEGWMS